MLNNQNGKIYTLTVTRSILRRVATIIPDIVNIIQNTDDENDLSDEEKEELSLDATDKLYANMNLVFYYMLKSEHKDITLEESNEIYKNFNNEYNDVDDKLMSLIEKVFTQGVPREKKKNINW